MTTYETVLADATRLPVADRIQLIGDLWDTLPSDALPPLSAEWVAEIQKRSAEHDAGSAETVSWDQVKAETLRGVGMPSTTQNEVEVRLTPDEALVLFEFLSRYSDTDQLRVEDQAEQRALWNLCCLLEKVLVEPFNPDYAKLLGSARDRLRDKWNEDSEPSSTTEPGRVNFRASKRGP